MPDATSPADGRHFATTRWSIVLAAGRRSEPDADDALAALCEAYWYPLYAYARRRGYSADDARDLTQGFFVTLLEKDFLQSADRERGRFRTFLLTIFQRFLGHERDRQHARKRGGGRPLLSINFEAGEERYGYELAHHETPERIYERQWALTLLERVVERLTVEFAQAGKSALFARIRSGLTGASAAPNHSETAQMLGMTEGAVRVAVHRMRDRYRELLRDEIAGTVETSDEIEDELNRLLAAFRTS